MKLSEIQRIQLILTPFKYIYDTEYSSSVFLKIPINYKKLHLQSNNSNAQ